jgi:uncharacterized protein (DUF1015 family)
VVAELRAFRALRPRPEVAARVAAPPYDVVDVAEARALADGNPDSFLHVSRPEIDLPDGADPAAVHARGRWALADLAERGVLTPDPAPTLSVYRQHRQGREQTGLVAAATVADYRSGVIAVHERTRPDKEDDRTEHLDALSAHDEPVFLMYPDRAEIDALVAGVVTAGPPDVDLVDPDGVRHTLWIVADDATGRALTDAFRSVPRLYVADGHHRSAAAARLHDLRAEPGSAVFPVVVFPAGQLTVLPYQRVVADLAGQDVHGLLGALADRFEIELSDAEPDRHQFGMYAQGRWLLLHARPGSVDEDDRIGRLDVSLLQDRVLGPLLGVTDPRTDTRIGFVGGVRGRNELERLVDCGRYQVAFALHPTSPDEVIAVAELGLVMPPKSTWFEPKLASGLFVHPLRLG